MIKSYRSKRRKIQEELNYHRSIVHNEDSKNSNSNNQLICEKSDLKNLSTQSPLENQSAVSVSGDLVTKKSSEFSSLDSCSVPEICKIESPIKNICNDAQINSKTKLPIDIKLRNWAIECNVPHSTINKLLHILRKENYPSFQKLPLDSRTLLHATSTKITNIEFMNPGWYYHFGLANGIKRISLKLELESEVKVVIGVDGLPLSKSSASQFWPILAYIYPHSQYVFPIGIYHGNEKPHDSNNYLQYFVEETKDLILNGIRINDNNLKVSIRAFCCDAPAKSFVLKVKGHTGFSSCTRCFQSGEYLNNRTCFPYMDGGSQIRTHNGYVTMTQKSHHISQEITSNLIELSGFDIVNSFPLDYMHLVLLGVMRKLIHLWMWKGPVKARLSGRKISELSKSLLSLKSCIPIEFSRKPRLIEDVSRWKATELRQFLLYTGPIVLKEVLTKESYDNFMSLSIAMTILLGESYKNKLDYAKQLIHYFVQSFQTIYGAHFVSHNVHGLLHIADDYERFGTLDSCSCFPFENFMKHLKNALRKNDKPLQQYVRRYYENSCQDEDNCLINHTDSLQTKKTHDKGPMLEDITCNPQFSIFQFQNFTINIKKNVDSFILTNQGDIVKVMNIAHLSVNNEPIIIGYAFLKKRDLYNKPLKSSKINIQIVEDISSSLEVWKISNVKSKVMMIYFKNEHIAIPIIHSIK